MLRKDKRCVVKGTALDLFSNLLQISYSVDASDWRIIYPDDEIYDFTTETFTIETDPLPNGEHTIVVKAIDTEGNVGSGKVVLDVK